MMRNTRGLNYANLLFKCDKISFAVNSTEEQAKLIFNETQKQSNCQKWYDFRSGRVTASVSGEVCNSRDEVTPVSLIKKICYNMSESHVNHSVNLSGLILNPNFPYLGASPDGIVNCLCCGVGCLEINGAVTREI